MSVGKDFVNVINDATKSKTSPRDIEATVSRVDGKTAWVRMPGSETETPVKLTIDAKKGDTVQVRVSKGRAWITGNTTAPPTDDKVAKQAMQAVSTLSKKSVKIQESVEAIEESIEDGEFTVEGVYVQYILSTSNASVVPYQGMDWSDTLPTYVSGTYYWTRTVTVTEDGEEHISDPVLDLGAQLTAEVDQAQKSTNNHFWHDNTGAYVTEQNGSYATGYAVRITNSGIIQSYNGNMLSSWTGSGVSFYRTGSNTAMASFGSSGIAFDNTLPFTIGNTSGSYIKWYQENNTWKIKVVADEITFGGSDLSQTLSDMEDDIDDVAGDVDDAAKTATNYITASGSGINVHAANDSYNYANVSSDGLKVYQSVNGTAKMVAQFGSTATIKTNPDSAYKVYIDGDQLDIRYNDYYAVVRLAGANTNGGQIIAYDKSHIKHGLLSCDVVSTSYENGRISIQGSSDGGGLYDSNIGSNGGYLIKSSSTGKYVQINTKAYSETLSTYETLRINSNGTLGISGSSRRWKKDIRYLADDSMNVQKDEILNGIRKLSASIFKYKEKPERNPDIDWDTDSDNLGFIAEDVAKYLPQAAIFDHQNESLVNDWSERNIIPAILLLAQEAMNRVESLERRIS